MKIKRSSWRDRARQLGLALVPFLFLIVIFRGPCALRRVRGMEMAPALKDGDLLLVLRKVRKYAPGDVVLRCQQDCKLMRIVVEEGEELKKDASGAVFAGDAKLASKLGEKLSGEILAWRTQGGYLLKADVWTDEEFEQASDYVWARERDLNGKVFLALRVRGF